MKHFFLFAFVSLLFVCCSETDAESEIGDDKPSKFNPRPIILPGMPDLEWTAENLSGGGGIEVEGITYYTYNEAVVAIRQVLGPEWRLPNHEEVMALDNLGSTWVEEGPQGRPGRWFGGNHDTDHAGSLFFDAAGGFVYSLAGLYYRGKGLYFYYDPIISRDPKYMGGFYFDADEVHSSDHGSARTNALPVRCVRDVK